tara:strand:+ start:1258 stop:1581 length:324 start_codon:yes stop_codon:yes gene_type:complete
MKYVFDIDGTICTKVKKRDYTKAEPLVDRINKINRLYDEGHQITMFTARGMGTFEDNAFLAIERYYQFTTEQLKSWNVKYHHLILGKPSGDIYVDDKGINDEGFFAD